MKILLLGADGQVGWELRRSLAPLGEVVALGHGRAPDGVDFASPEAVVALVRAQRPQVIVNAAAYTAVDEAETEPELARQINAFTPGLLAREAAALSAWLVHYSTDYVFDGQGQHRWREEDVPAPLSVYGHSKLEGERGIAASGCKHLILRTGWVYSTRRRNFATTMLQLAQAQAHWTVVDDQWGAPTGADLLADVTAQVLRQLWQRPMDGGLYHCQAAGETTWHAYAEWLVSHAQQQWPGRQWRVQHIAPVASSAYPTAARRPHNTRLDTGKLQRTFGLYLPPWQAGVARLLTEIFSPVFP